MRKLKWKDPVETVYGSRVQVTNVRYDRVLVKGLHANPDIGRIPGPEMEWVYPLSGKAPNGFLPDLKNVNDGE